jgi:hypothetical protein
VEPDADSDGLPDSWATAYGLDPNSADTDGNGVADPDEDPDGDGLTNLEEYLAGSDPTVATGVAGGSSGLSCAPGAGPSFALLWWAVAALGLVPLGRRPRPQRSGSR